MTNCTCMYCYDGLCFKASKSEEGMLAVPCDGCDTNITESATTGSLNIIL